MEHLQDVKAKMSIIFMTTREQNKGKIKVPLVLKVYRSLQWKEHHNGRLLSQSVFCNIQGMVYTVSNGKFYPFFELSWGLDVLQELDINACVALCSLKDMLVS